MSSRHGKLGETPRKWRTVAGGSVATWTRSKTGKKHKYAAWRRIAYVHANLVYANLAPTHDLDCRQLFPSSLGNYSIPLRARLVRCRNQKYLHSTESTSSLPSSPKGERDASSRSICTMRRSSGDSVKNASFCLCSHLRG